MISIGIGEKSVLKECDYIVENTKSLNYKLLKDVWNKMNKLSQ